MSSDSEKLLQDMSPMEMVDQMNKYKVTQNTALKEHCNGVWAAGDQLDNDTLRQLAYSGEFAKIILAEHPFIPMDNTIDRINSCFSILSISRNALIDAYGEHHAAIMYDGFGKTEKTQEKVTALIFQFAFAASSLVQAYRGFRNIAPEADKKINELVPIYFENAGLQAFVQKLRNCYGHSKVFKALPLASIEFSKGERHIYSSIEFNKDELLSHNEWNVAARQFIEMNDKMNAIEILEKYYTCSQRLQNNYLEKSGLIYETGFQEIARSREAIRTYSLIVWLGIILQNAKKNGANPYAHLSKYFSDKEIKRARCFPAGSKSQVDFLIAICDPLNLCDTDLRQKLYDLFERA